MKLRTNGIYILLILSVLLVVASAFITYYNTREKEQSMHTVIRRYKSIASSENLPLPVEGYGDRPTRVYHLG